MILISKVRIMIRMNNDLYDYLKILNNNNNKYIFLFLLVYYMNTKKKSANTYKKKSPKKSPKKSKTNKKGTTHKKSKTKSPRKHTYKTKSTLISYSSFNVKKNKTKYNFYFDTKKKELDDLGLYLFGISRGFVESLTSGYVLPSLTKGTYYKSLSQYEKNTLKDCEYTHIGHDYTWFYKTLGGYLKQKKKLATGSLRKQQLKDYWIRYIHDKRGVSISIGKTKKTVLSGSLHNIKQKFTTISSFDVAFFNSLIESPPSIQLYIQHYQQRELMYSRLENIFTTTNTILELLVGKKNSGGKILIKSKTLTYLENIWGYKIRTSSGTKPAIILYIQPKNIHNAILTMITFNELIKILKYMLQFQPLENNPIYKEYIIWKMCHDKVQPILELYKSFIKTHISSEGGGGGGGGISLDSVLPTQVFLPEAPTTLLMLETPNTLLMPEAPTSALVRDARGRMAT